MNRKAKTIHVILAFHAQEPLWDLPERVISTLRDDDVRREAVGNDNWVRRRAEEGRDIYADLLQFGHKIDAPVCLEATNEVLMQIEGLPFPDVRTAARDARLRLLRSPVV